MYTHIVEYRYRTIEGNITPMKTLEFELDRQLHYDGPGEWKVVCANIISSKTGINTSWIFVDDGTMKMRCLGKVQKHNSNSSSRESRFDKGNSSGRGLGNIASGLGSGLRNAVSGTLSETGKAANKGLNTLNKDLDKRVEENKKKRLAIEEKAIEISKIEFGTTAHEVQSQLEELIIYGNTLSSQHFPIKKAVYTKVTFGIMRLKSFGANDIAAFYEAQAKKIKPNLWNAIWFWATFSNT